MYINEWMLRSSHKLPVLQADVEERGWTPTATANVMPLRQRDEITYHYHLRGRVQCPLPIAWARMQRLPRRNLFVSKEVPTMLYEHERDADDARI